MSKSLEKKGGYPSPKDHPDFDFQGYVDWQRKLNAKPSDVKKHPIIRVKINGKVQAYEYVSIDTIYTMMNYFFAGFWRVEVLDDKVIANSITMRVRLHYYHPYMSCWMSQDGVGAAALQVNKGALATDISQIKTASVEMAYPKAETQAIKDAAKKLGKRFGSQLNKASGNYGIVIDSKVGETLTPIDKLLEE